MKYLKKAIPVDAWQIDMLEIIHQGDYPDWVEDARRQGKIRVGYDKSILIIETLEGNMSASEGDYLIKGPKGEYWFNKREIFEEMYEEWDGSYEYDTGRPIPGAKKKTNHIEVTKVTELPDGSANYEFLISDDVRDSLLRLALRTAIENAIEKGDEWRPRDNDEQPEITECDWIDESIRCKKCNCWKSRG